MPSISDNPDTKKAEFLITMRAIKSLDYILFCLQMCSWRLIVNKKIWLNRKLTLNFRVSFHKKNPEFLISIRAIERFGTILFMPCVLIKIHCEQTDFGYLSVSRQTLTNVTFNRHLVASCCQWSCVVATIIAKAKMYLKVPFLGLGFNREWGNWRWIPAPFPHPSRMAIPSLSRPLPIPDWGPIILLFRLSNTTKHSIFFLQGKC